MNQSVANPDFKVRKWRSGCKSLTSENFIAILDKRTGFMLHLLAPTNPLDERSFRLACEFMEEVPLPPKGVA